MFVLLYEILIGKASFAHKVAITNYNVFKTAQLLEILIRWPTSPQAIMKRLDLRPSKNRTYRTPKKLRLPTIKVSKKLIA